MSAFDPSLGGSLSGAALQSLLAQVQLELDAATASLLSQLSVGQVIEGTVLSPQGGADRLQILGRTVVADLPPGIPPGTTLALQVSGLSGNQVILRNLGVVAAQPEASQNSPQAPQSSPPAPQSSSQPTQQPPPGTTPPGQRQTAGTISPPAQAARPSLVPPSEGTPTPARPPSSAEGGPLRTGSPAPPPAPSGLSSPESPSQPVMTGRSQAAGPMPNASSAQTTRPPFPPAPAASVPVEAEEIARSVAAASAPLTEEAAVEARLAAARAARLLPGTPPPVRSARSNLPSQPTAPPPPSSAEHVAPTPQRAPSMVPLTAEERVLARLGIPRSTLAAGAVRILQEAAAALPRLAARLESLLPEHPERPPLLVLRTVLPFAARIDPSKPAALPEQIAAYVEHVVEGPEGKLSGLVRLLQAALPEIQTPASPQPHDAASQPPGRQPTPTTRTPLPSAAAVPLQVPTESASETATASGQPRAPQSAPIVAQAQVQERLAALAHDVKTALFAVQRDPPPDATPAFTAAVGDTLAAMTAVQMSVLDQLANDPRAFVIPLPIVFKEGGRPVELRIERDAPGRRGPLDGDDFRIAFVLETASLGMVVIDVETVGRSVRVDVKTERESAAAHVRATFGDLRERLERLRYRVAAMRAAVLPPRATSAQAPPPQSDRTARFDTRA